MSTAATKLAKSVEEITSFVGGNLAAKVSALEHDFARKDKIQIRELLRSSEIGDGLVEAAKTIKLAASQIDVVLHALGILTYLPLILEEGEQVQSLSLGAGSSSTKRFDLETDRRLAEFTFIDWKGNDNTRLQKIFKDFYRLAEFNSTKSKEIWLADDTYVLKFFRSNSSIHGATHKSRGTWEEFSLKYPTIETISAYYRIREKEVSLRVYDRDIPGLAFTEECSPS